MAFTGINLKPTRTIIWVCFYSRVLGVYILSSIIHTLIPYLTIYNIMQSLLHPMALHHAMLMTQINSYDLLRIEVRIWFKNIIRVLWGSRYDGISVGSGGSVPPGCHREPSKLSKKTGRTGRSIASNSKIHHVGQPRHSAAWVGTFGGSSYSILFRTCASPDNSHRHAISVIMIETANLVTYRIHQTCSCREPWCLIRFF